MTKLQKYDDLYSFSIVRITNFKITRSEDGGVSYVFTNIGIHTNNILEICYKNK